MRIYKRTLIPATTFLVISCLLTTLLPISGANWREVLMVSGNIDSIQWPPQPLPQSQAGTTLSATLTADGFAEERDEVMVFGVRGEICVENGGEYPTEGLFILDTLQSRSGSGQFQDYVSEPVDVSAKPVLEAGGEYCYPYEFNFEPIKTNGVEYRNTVSVTIINYFGWLPGGNHCEGTDACPFGPNPKTDFVLPDESAVSEISSTEVPTATETPSTQESVATEPPSTQEPVATETPALEEPIIEPSTDQPTETPTPGGG